MYRTTALFVCLLTLNSSTIAINNTPIMGILSQETYIIRDLFPGQQYDSFISASYVKFLESAGARVIPVWIGQTEEYYRRVVNYTNGLLLPGGGTYFNETGGYGEAATSLYKIALDYNNKGIYYPIWGTCLGMQALMYAALNGTKDIRVDCLLRNTAVPLAFSPHYKKSRLLSHAPTDVLEILRTENVTYNQHIYCITSEALSENNLLEDWHILATNKDVNGIEFISAIKHKKFPLHGLQFHPEKNAFEFSKNRNFPHSANSVKLSQYIANHIVNESRNNENSFPDLETESRSLIHNFNPVYTGNVSDNYNQLYVFLKKDFETYQLT